MPSALLVPHSNRHRFIVARSMPGALLVPHSNRHRAASPRDAIAGVVQADVRGAALG